MSFQLSSNILRVEAHIFPSDAGILVLHQLTCQKAKLWSHMALAHVPQCTTALLQGGVTSMLESYIKQSFMLKEINTWDRKPEELKMGSKNIAKEL